MMTSSKILFCLCVSFILGVAVESTVKIPQFVLWIFLISGLLIIFYSLGSSVVRKSTIVDFLTIVGFCLLFLVLGILRFQISEFNIAKDELSKFNDSGQITLTGVIIAEPVLKDNSQQLKIKTEDFGSVILVTTSRYPEYHYLDKLKIIGKLQTPMETEDFSYKNYLLKDHIYSVVYFPKIEAAGKENKNLISGFYSGVLWIKQKLRQSIQTSFLPPQSSMLQGIILGDKGAVPQDVKDKFQIAGLSHILAVSGLHIVILTGVAMYFLMMFVARGSAFYAISAFIFVYVVMVGMPSSAVRAGILAVIYLLAQKLGRQTMSLRSVVLVACCMLCFNPLLLFYDVGFQLSFLAVLGIILLEPILKNSIRFLADRFFKFKLQGKVENAVSLITVTISAQIFTLPVIIYNFGNVSFVSLFTNLLILPVIPAVMSLGFLSAAAGAFFSFLGWAVSVPCYFLLTYVFWVVDAFSKPWAHKVISNVSWIWVAVFYLFLGILTRYFNKKMRLKFLNY